VTFWNWICPLEGQFSGGSKFQSPSPSAAVVSSSAFNRATAPREVSSVVQFSTSFSNAEFATSITLSAIPTCPPLTCSRNDTAIATTLVATAAPKRDRTRLSHLWRHKRRNSGRWELSMLWILSHIAALDQPNDRMVSRPSIWRN
jgi:hypothetical protein